MVDTSAPDRKPDRPICPPCFTAGFASKAVATECVREFAQIEECKWARQMPAVILHHADRDDDGNED